MNDGSSLGANDTDELIQKTLVMDFKSWELKSLGIQPESSARGEKAKDFIRDKGMMCKLEGDNKDTKLVFVER